MTKLIGALIIALVIYGVYEIWVLWDNYDHEKDLQVKSAQAARIDPNGLAGMPSGLSQTYEIAQRNGAKGIRKWLQAYGSKVQDPRRAWIELDYVVQVAHEDPIEAKKVFAEVKARTPESSQIYPRIKELEKTFQ